jgi:hypothetical protein
VAEPTAPLPPAAPPEAQHAAEVVEHVKEAPAEAKQAIAIDQKLLMSEVQMLLAEKRTAYALLRTGVTVSLVPLSIWTVLVATSRLYNVFDILWLLVPVMVLAVGLFLLGMWLVYHALAHVRHIENVMLGLRKSDTMLETLLFREAGFRYLPSFRVLRRFRRTKGAS